MTVSRPVVSQTLVLVSDQNNVEVSSRVRPFLLDCATLYPSHNTPVNPPMLVVVSSEPTGVSPPL